MIFKGKFQPDIEKLERNFSKFVFKEQKLKCVLNDPPVRKELNVWAFPAIVALLTYEWLPYDEWCQIEYSQSTHT